MSVFGLYLRFICAMCAGMCFAVLTRAQPTISGVNAFWYLGGPLSDGAGCSTGGWCYYAQAAWTANPNGHAGTPTCTVENNPVGGSVSLSRYTCSTTEATSTTHSESCDYDIAVYVTYPDGAQSAPSYVLTNTPASTRLQPNFPKYSQWIYPPGSGNNGWQSLYSWTLKDLCSNPLRGLDVNETFGYWTIDYPFGTNWPFPPATSGYQPSYNFTDTLGESTSSNATPPAEYSPGGFGSTAVYHNYPWDYFVGSTTFGDGVVVHSDTQQWYQDHATHSVANW